MTNNDSYSLALFVHELTLSVGHSNAMIETLRRIDHHRLENLYLICYECDDIRELFPEFHQKVRLIRVRPARIYPFLLKVWYFQLVSRLIQWFRLPKNCLKLSIGTAILNPDLVNIQFISNQWAPYFFQGKKLGFLSGLYKKFLYFCLTSQENRVYARKDLTVSVLADFMSDFLVQKYQFPKNKIQKIRSSVDLERFKIQGLVREELFGKLCQNYPQLKQLDLNCPIALFIGAFERKGLKEALDGLEKLPGSQIIAIGKGESKGQFKLERNGVTVVHIPFTREVPAFYELCDLFIFPTQYEPFGLVILEAAAMGLPLVLTRKEVGATELLENLPQVNVFETPEQIQTQKFDILVPEQRMKNRERVKEVLKEFSWDRAGREFQQMINQVLGHE